MRRGRSRQLRHEATGVAVDERQQTAAAFDDGVDAEVTLDRLHLEVRHRAHADGVVAAPRIVAQWFDRGADLAGGCCAGEHPTHAVRLCVLKSAGLAELAPSMTV